MGQAGSRGDQHGASSCLLSVKLWTELIPPDSGVQQQAQSITNEDAH